MKLSLILATACVVLAGSFALAIAQSSQPSNLFTMNAWSRPALVVEHGIQMRRSVAPHAAPVANGPSIVLRFEPIPYSTIQSLQQYAASQQKTLAWHPKKISDASVFVDVVSDTAPGRWFKAVRASDDPLAFEVVLPAPIGGWYNQPLHICSSVLADDHEVFSTDSIVTLAP